MGPKRRFWDRYGTGFGTALLAPLSLLEGAAKNFDAYLSGAPHRGGIFDVLRIVAGTVHHSLRGTAFHAVELL
jgi:hypothetical protein